MRLDSTRSHGVALDYGYTIMMMNGTQNTWTEDHRAQPSTDLELGGSLHDLTFDGKDEIDE